MNYAGCEANGICSGWNEFPEEFKAKVFERIAPLREEARALLRAPEYARTSFHVGSRFTDDHNILMRALSGMARNGGTFGTFDMGAAMKFTDETIRAFILAAYLDAASADHWYLWEKDWE